MKRPLAAALVAALAVVGALTVPLSASAAPTAKVMVDTQRMSDATLNSTQNGTYAKGRVLTLSCYKRGQSVKGYFSPWISGGYDNLWYRVSDGYFVSDVDIDTGSNDPVTGQCTTGPTPASVDTNAWYTINAQVSGLKLDVAGGRTSNGTHVQQYAGNGSASQKFRFVANGDGTYRLYSALSTSEVWDVAGAGTGNGTKVQTWSWANVAQQKWTPYTVSSNVVAFRPAHASSRCLDVAGGSRSSGVQLQIYDCNGTVSQQFRLDVVGTVQASHGPAAITWAMGQQGTKVNPAGTLCNPYSAHWGTGSACSNGNRAENWCADFAAQAWQAAGISFAFGYGKDLSPAASSFYQWGVKRGTWHALGTGYTPKPGDAVLYGSPSNAAHIGLYVSGSASSPNVINGNITYKGVSQVIYVANMTSNGGGASLTGYVSAP